MCNDEKSSTQLHSNQEGQIKSNGTRNDDDQDHEHWYWNDLFLAKKPLAW